MTVKEKKTVGDHYRLSDSGSRRSHIYRDGCWWGGNRSIDIFLPELREKIFWLRSFCDGSRAAAISGFTHSGHTVNYHMSFDETLIVTILDNF